MEIEKELKFFREERQKSLSLSQYPGLLKEKGYDTITMLIDQIISDLVKAHTRSFSKPKLLKKYRELYIFITKSTTEMLMKRADEQKRLNVNLPPNQKFPLPDPTPEEQYLSLACRYVYSAVYALEERKDGWNKPQ